MWLRAAACPKDGVEFNFFSSPEKVNERHITLRMLNAHIWYNRRGTGIQAILLPRAKTCQYLQGNNISV